jgi:single stranded DNA-binding protein
VDRDFGKNENGEKETDFIDCVAWRATGEFVSKYFTKGTMIVVSGRLQIRPWTDKEGNKRRTAEIVADNVYFGESRRSNEGGSYNAGGYSSNGGFGGGNGGYGNNGGFGGGNNNYGGNGGFGGNGGYGDNAFSGGSNNYGAPPVNYATPPSPGLSDFAMLEDDDAQLPF